MGLRIEDYAVIGDTQSAALVGNDGSIDWLCLPRFDSGACFAALLGTPEHGRWLLSPEGRIRQTRRRYRGDSLVLETEFHTEDGVVRVVDGMPVRTRWPDLVRVVEGVKGKVRMRMELVIRFDYGSIVPWVRRIDGGIRAVAGPDTIVLRSPVSMHGENLRTVAEFEVLVVESRRDGAAHQCERSAVDQAATLHRAVWHDHLRRLAVRNIAANAHNAAEPVRKQLQHLHCVAEIEMKDLVACHPMQCGERVGR